MRKETGCWKGTRKETGLEGDGAATLEGNEATATMIMDTKDKEYIHIPIFVII